MMDKRERKTRQNLWMKVNDWRYFVISQRMRKQFKGANIHCEWVGGAGSYGESAGKLLDNLEDPSHNQQQGVRGALECLV